MQFTLARHQPKEVQFSECLDFPGMLAATDINLPFCGEYQQSHHQPALWQIDFRKSFYAAEMNLQ